MNETEYDDLEQMKQQMALLQRTLDRQTIINDRLLRDAVRAKAGSINRDSCVITVIGILAIPYCIWVFRFLHISVPFSIVTALFLLAAVAYNLFTHRGFRTSMLVSAPLADIARLTVRMKLLHARWLRFSLPFLFLWLSWFVYEILSLTSVSHDERLGILIGGAVGGMIGGIFGYVAYRRTQRLANEILQQVEE